jgi:hypothetical protein
MRSDLQKAALQKLARLTQNEHLPAELRNNLQGRVFKRCLDPKKLTNGVNGVNGLGGSSRSLVTYLFGNFRNLQDFRLEASSIRY